jgi:hypothetical protein
METFFLSLVFVALVTGTCAFVTVDPRRTSSSSTTTILFAFEDEVGAQPPLGFFDPLGLVADGNERKFNRLRYVELKHGRISMLAVLGYLVQEAGIRLPGKL